jgi:DNA repair protein RadC
MMQLPSEPSPSNEPSTRTAQVGERPRERLRRVGARNLSATELIALVVGAGSGHSSAMAVASRLHLHFDCSLQRMGVVDVATLEQVSGVGTATAARVAAAIELGRRAAIEPQMPSDPIRGPADVFRRFGPQLAHLQQEEFHALLLDTRHRVLREVLVTRGLLDASLIHPREVFRIAVSEGAAAVILVHNHPSGDPSPSLEDRAVTRQLADAGQALGIAVLDHVVIGRGRYVSLAADLPGGRASSGSGESGARL